METIKQIKAYFDRFCQDCGAEISQYAGGGAKRCEECRVIHRREYRREWAREKAKEKARARRKGRKHGNATS